MKRLSQILFFSFSFLMASQSLSAQIFGNTVNTGYGGYNANQIVWLKIITGPTDNGSFTHYGLYDHPTTGVTCEIKFAIYSHDATNDRPDADLTHDYLAAPTNGVWNEKALTTPIPISPSTTYWIGLRFNCNYGSGREVGVNWANQPLKYKSSWSFFSAWPNPAGSLSSFGAVNNVALYLVGNNQVLPVEMLSFDANKEDTNAKLTWETASEINNAGWNIQRSDNGFTWHTIDWVDGNGNSDDVSTYQYEDELTKQGLFFYRLEQEDYDGQKAYSEVRSVEYIKAEVTLSPNPASDNIYMRGIEGAQEYKLFDAQGTYLIADIMTNDGRIDISSLTTGIYFVEINGKAYRFVKE